ncbi:MAG: sugar phosphate isomerase/epimerase family protein, partial [Armatimonadota bacterium]|nr:sugar phosphate isomerase/epimerase family protein [Armatimonadota bacterium]
MRVSIISDEISCDPMSAAELAAEWGLRHLELRMFYGNRAPRNMTASDIELVAEAAATFGLDVPSISPGLFKIRLDDGRIAGHRGELRVQCLDMAQMLGAGTMVVFPYVRADRDEPEDRWPSELVMDLRETAQMAAERDIVVAVENEPVCYAATGQSMAKLLEAIDEPNCRANWDPANHWVYRHESFSAGYEALRKHISHVHVKDHLPGEGRHQTVPPGHGQVGWPGQVRT